MAEMIAYCGLDCAGCEAYLATQANDEAAKVKILEKWRAEFGTPEMPLSVVTCDGCKSTGRQGGYSNECPVKACASAKELENCAHCSQYETCEILEGLIGNITAAKTNLAAIRAAL